MKVAAHPFGYFGINRGILKCIDNKTLPEEIINHIDGIEVICGGMGHDLNDKAARYAGEHDLPITGGSDAHVLPSVGGVVTGVKADTVEGFLEWYPRKGKHRHRINSKSPPQRDDRRSNCLELYTLYRLLPPGPL